MGGEPTPAFQEAWYRHDLLGCLNQIVLYSEIIAEDAEAMGQTRRYADLGRIRASAHASPTT